MRGRRWVGPDRQGAVDADLLHLSRGRRSICGTDGAAVASTGAGGNHLQIIAVDDERLIRWAINEALSAVASCSRHPPLVRFDADQKRPAFNGAEFFGVSWKVSLAAGP